MQGTDCKERREQKDLNKPPPRGPSWGSALPCWGAGNKPGLHPAGDAWLRRWDVLQPRAKVAIYSPVEQVINVQKEPQDAGRVGQGCAGSRVGGAGPEPAAFSPQPPWNRGQESRLWSKALFRGYFKRCEDSFWGTRGAPTLAAHPCESWGCSLIQALVSVASAKYYFPLNLNMFQPQTNQHGAAFNIPLTNKQNPSAFYGKGKSFLYCSPCI